MNIGTVVTWKSRNPNSNKTFIGVVVLNDDEKSGNVIVYQGFTHVPDEMIEEAPIGGYTVISLPESELTVIDMYK